MSVIHKTPTKPSPIHVGGKDRCSSRSRELHLVPVGDVGLLQTIISNGSGTLERSNGGDMTESGDIRVGTSEKASLGRLHLNKDQKDQRRTFVKLTGIIIICWCTGV